MHQRFRVLCGPHEGCSFDLQEPGIRSIGRHQQHNEICLPDPLLSRVHCEVEVDGDRVVISDLDSDSGTFVNGQRIRQHQLRHGDIVRIGDTQLAFQAIEVPKANDAASETRSLAATMKFANDDEAPIPFAPDSASPLAFAAEAPAPGPIKAATAAPPAPTRLAVFSTQSLSGLDGSTLAHFELGAVLGKGHCGYVFRAKDLKANRCVALKVLHPDFPKNDEEMQRFVKAMKIAGGLRHPHLLTVYGAGRVGLHCWIAMELVEGESLAQMLARLAALGTHDWQLAFRATVHLGRALYGAQKQYLVHRNLTPSNVLFRSADNLWKVSDLVLAQALAGSALRQVSLRTKVAAELPYLAPEQAMNNPTFDCRTDIYSLGVIVYALLAGAPPFLGKTSGETIAKILHEEPVPPRLFDAEMPGLFEEILMRMLAKQPADRYPTAAALLADLARVAPDAA